MRQFFAAGMAVSLVAAALVGAVFAFTATAVDDTGNSAAVGSASLALIYTPDGAAILGPNDDSAVDVGDGSVDNDGDFDLDLTGDVTIDAVSGGGSCGTGDFVGSVSGLVASLLTTDAADDFDALIATNGSAPEDCQGETVDYTVTITGTT